MENRQRRWQSETIYESARPSNRVRRADLGEFYSGGHCDPGTQVAVDGDDSERVGRRHSRKIEKILAEGGTDSGKKKLDEILRPMLPEAKEVDALFYHLDVQGTGTKTLSSLRINVVGLDLETFADEKHRTDFWNSFAKQLPKDFPEGATVEVTRDRSGTTGGRKAYQGTFLTTLPAGGKVYTVLHVIAYAPGKAHVWRLRADSENFPTASRNWKRLSTRWKCAPNKLGGISARLRAANRYKDSHSRHTAIAAAPFSIHRRNPVAE